MNVNEWRNADDNAIKALPFHVAEWLAEFGSLTEKLSRYVDTVKLDVLREGEDQLTRDEAEALVGGEQAKGQIREVVLYGPEKPWIYARTSMPMMNSHWIQKLGSKPLGSILFTDQELRRQFLQVGQLDKESELFRDAVEFLEKQTGLAMDNITQLWARRSLWKKKDKDDGMLVCEVFLPDAPLYR